MHNKSSAHAFIATMALLVFVVACGSSKYAKMRTENLDYLNLETLDDTQLYSGNRDIIFDKVVPSETGTSGYKALVNQPPFIIAAHTPGQVVEYDSIAAELAIWYDGMIPPLVYKDNGRGVELISIDFNIGLDQYLRRDRLLNYGIRETTFIEPYYLSRELSGKKIKLPKPRKAEGIEIEIKKSKKIKQGKKATKEKQPKLDKQAKKALKAKEKAEKEAEKQAKKEAKKAEKEKRDEED